MIAKDKIFSRSVKENKIMLLTIAFLLPILFPHFVCGQSDKKIFEAILMESIETIKRECDEIFEKEEKDIQARKKLIDKAMEQNHSRQLHAEHSFNEDMNRVILQLQNGLIDKRLAEEFIIERTIKLKNEYEYIKKQIERSTEDQEKLKARQDSLTQKSKMFAKACSFFNTGCIALSRGNGLKMYNNFKQSEEIFQRLNIISALGPIYACYSIYFFQVGENPHAIITAICALDYFKKTLQHSWIQFFSERLGDLYFFSGLFPEAMISYNDALQHARKRRLPKNEIKNLISLAKVNRASDDFEKSLSRCYESLRLAQKYNDSDAHAAILNLIGANLSARGDYEKAICYFESAINFSKKCGINREIAAGFHNLGTIYSSLGNYEKALYYLNEALKVERMQKMPLWLTLYQIGLFYLKQRKYKEAEAVFIEARRSEQTSDSLKSSAFHNCMAELYIAQGRYDEALLLLREDHLTLRWGALSINNFHTLRGIALKGNGKLLEASHEFLKAVIKADELRSKVRAETGFFISGPMGGYLRSYKYLSATLSERLLQSEKESGFIMYLIHGIWAVIKKFLITIGLLNKSIQSNEWIRDSNVIIEDEIFKSYGKNLASAAFYFTEATKGRILLETIARGVGEYSISEIIPEIRIREKSLINQLSAIEIHLEELYQNREEEYPELTIGKRYENLVSQKDSLKREVNSLIGIIQERYPRYAALKYPKPKPAEQLPLKENEVLLEYAINDNASYLFVVRKGDVEKIIKISNTKEELENLVKEFCLPFNRDPVSKKIPYEKFSIEKGKVLYDILLAIALKDLPLESQIIIVPDGILGVLPFQALVMTPGQDLQSTLFVADQWNITYSQSASVLALNRLLQKPKAQRTLFALGNPIYNDKDTRYISHKQRMATIPLNTANFDQYAGRGLASYMERGWITIEDVYRPLPETEWEVKSIASLFNVPPKPPDVLLGIFANETNLRKSLLRSYRYLHFATHAALSDRVRGIKEPFILLGQVENKGKDDGFLKLTEVLELQLDTDMVVLAACLTGRGEIMEGEGVMNFARAFQQAGARSVLVSLWEVVSEMEKGKKKFHPSEEYMRLFYEFLSQGKSKSEALMLARYQIKAKYPNPFFWAPFILYGER